MVSKKETFSKVSAMFEISGFHDNEDASCGLRIVTICSDVVGD
jgi:hypothetical protein